MVQEILSIPGAWNTGQPVPVIDNFLIVSTTKTNVIFDRVVQFKIEALVTYVEERMAQDAVKVMEQLPAAMDDQEHMVKAWLAGINSDKL